MGIRCCTLWCEGMEVGVVSRLLKAGADGGVKNDKGHGD